MRDNLTSFDTSRHHIHLEFSVTDSSGVLHSVAGILDTGAPRTEFSDQFLIYAGFLNGKNENATLNPGLQTQKYGWPSTNVLVEQLLESPAYPG